MKRNLLRACALACALACFARAGSAEEAVNLLAVDQRLYELGYRDGDCTGVLNDAMKNALRNFQQVNGLGITGEPDAGTVLVLNSENAVGQAAYLENLARQTAEMPALVAGSAGDAVARLQRALKELGYFEGSSDGAFGDATAEAVRRFQFANGLSVTGTADAAVFARVYGEQPVRWEDFLASCTASLGAEGPAVRMLQYWLRAKGYFEGDCTGRYGDATQRAVRNFQIDSGLESSGDLDAQSCRALYGNVTALVADASAPRRGSSNAGELCRRLIELGYAAHDSFDMQTELALMQFQRASGLPVTGVGDAATMQRLSAPDAAHFASFRSAGQEAAGEADFASRLVSQVTRMLGRQAGFDEEFGLIQYAYMKCGVAIAERAQFALVSEDPDAATPGDVMVLKVEGVEHCGVTGSDGALFYRDGEGRILMCYPEGMNPEWVRLYRLPGQ